VQAEYGDIQGVGFKGITPGGNINHVTRVMTATIALETSKGNLSLALGLEIVLIALAVASGNARAGFAIKAVARQLGLDFLPLAEERYDLAIWRREYFEPPVQQLLAFCATAAFASRAAEFGGYGVECLGEVRYNGP